MGAEWTKIAEEAEWLKGAEGAEGAEEGGQDRALQASHTATEGMAVFQLDFQDISSCNIEA